MAIAQPSASDPLNAPDHALQHRIIASDPAAPVQSLIVDSTGNVGAGVISPTAILHLKAGTAAANTSPMKFTPGTLLASPETGSLESNISGLFYTTLGDRRSIVQGSQPIVGSTTVADTLVETVIYTTTLAANELIAGESLWTHIFGYMSTRPAGPGDTCTIRTYIGTSLVLTNTLTGKHITDEPISIEPALTIRSVGSFGTVFGYAKCEIANLSYSSANTSTVVVDTTAVSSITISVQWDVANASNSITIAQGWTNVIW